MCLNPELKIEGLRDPEVKLETLLSLDDAQLKKWSEKSKDNNSLIKYKEWQTEIVKKTKTLKGSGAKKDVNVDTKTYRSMKVVLTNKKNKFIKKLLDEIAILKEHNKRNISHASHSK